MAKEAKDKEASESSGLADILEVAEKIGSPADSFAGAGITIAPDDDDDDDDLTNLGGGFGGAGAAALVAGGDDDDDDLPAASAFEPVALPSADPEPKPKAEPASTQKKVALVEPPAAESPKPEAKAKTPEPAKESSRESEPVVVAPSRAASAPAPAAAAANDEGGGGKTWLVLLGLAAAGAAVWFLVLNKPSEPPPKPIAEATTPANVQPAEPAKVEPPPVEPEPEPEPAMAVEGGSTGAEEAATGGSGDAAAAETGEAEPVPAAEDDAKAKWKSTRKLPRAKKEAADAPAPKEDPPTEPPPEPEPEPTPEPEPKPMTQAELDKKFSTECLLDPNKPGCEEFRKRQEAKLKDLDAHLPNKLSQNDIRGAVNTVKSKAKACGSQHGASSGETVRVKLSIEGATGKVLSASPISPHDSSALGKCVADVLSSATFPRFKSQQQGTTYPVTM